MPEKITILAVGGAGCRIMRLLREQPGAEKLHLIALDTDRTALDETGLPPENLLLAGELWRGGRGCGGDELDGQRAVAHERARLENFLRDSKFLVVVCGLGGGTASGGAPVVLSVAAKLKLPNFFIVTLPFMLEGYRRRNLAERVLSESLFEISDAVVSLPDDLLFSTLTGDTPLAKAFELADRECAGTVLALSAILSAGNLLNADLASFTTLLKRRKCQCSIGVGALHTAEECSAADAPEKLVSGVLASPLLGGPQVLKSADAVVVSMLGGSDLSLGEVRNTLELIGRYIPERAQQLTAASARPDWQNSRQLCVLAVKYDEETPIPGTAPEARRQAPRREAAREKAVPEKTEQLTLQFETVSKGIMERTTPVMWNNEDLDEPTFKRRNAVVDDGRRGGPRGR